MASEKFRKELILIDFKKNDFRFYNVSVSWVGHNNIQVILHYGKLGSKGSERLVRKDDMKQAMAFAYQKIYEKKAESFINLEHVKAWLGQSEPVVEKPAKKDKDKFPKKKQKDSPPPTKELPCDVCKTMIPISVYNKINDWGRNQGNWDKDINFIGYEKVLCIDCQFKYDIFKKRM